ncbi:MAG: CPBP family intramembrane metalloprotease [Myxococcales bacterium]|nr:CPBP family intramembrane metalloprotease [Myxococcales bacterium]
MTLLLAALWAAGLTLALMLLIAGLGRAGAVDPVTPVVCQVAVYGLGLFALLRVHGPDASIREFVAARAVHPGFYGLAALLGAGLNLSADRLYELVRLLWPPAEPDVCFELIFRAAGTTQQGVLVAAVVLAVPACEEVIFRGALFGRLALTRRPIEVIAWTGLCFALAHVEPRQALAILPMALCLGWVRHATGSLWPPLILHGCFNATSIALLYFAAAPTAPDAVELPPCGALEVPLAWELGSALLGLAAFGGMLWLARRERARRDAAT